MKPRSSKSGSYPLSFTATCLMLFTLLAYTAAAQQAPAALQDSLTLDAVISRVLAENPALQNAQSNYDAATARTGEAKAEYLPQLAGVGNYTRLDPVSQAKFGTGPVAAFSPNNILDFHLGAQGVLYDFGRTENRVAQAGTQQLSARQTLEQVNRNLAYEVVQRFYAVLFYRQSLKVEQQQIDVLTQNLNQTQRKIDNGRATEFDALTTKVRISNAQNALTDIQNAADQQLIQLRRLMGLPANAPVNLKGKFEEPQLTGNLEELAAQASQRRVELQLAQTSEHIAALQQKIVTASRYPSLNYTLTGGFKNGYLSADDASFGQSLNTLRANWSGTVGLNIPIFTGFRIKNQIAEAGASSAAAKAHTTDVSQQINAEVQQAQTNLSAYRTKLQTTQTQLDQANKAADQARARYANEVITNLDLLDTELALSQTQLTYLQALYNLVLGSYDLKRATGEKIW